MRARGHTFRCLLLLVSFTSTSAYFACRRSYSRSYLGIFYANDCGVSHGGFEWAGEYTATVKVSGEKGSLDLQFSAGLGDPLKRHRFAFTDFAEAAGKMTFRLEGKAAVLQLIDRDLIWSGRFDGYFSGNNSADSGERIGQLAVDVFEGFKSHYYIELRLKPDQESLRFLISGMAGSFPHA